VRPAVLIALAAVPFAAHADRLISIPIGRKIPFGTVRYEAALQPRENGVFESYLGFGVTTGIDAEIRTLRLQDEKGSAAVDLSYNVVAPFPGLSPGVSFGVQDVGDRTSDGRRFYGAATYRKMISGPYGDLLADITIGGYIGKRSTPFAGLSFPITDKLRLLAEHNGYRPSVGLELRPRKELGVRFYVRDHQEFVSLSLTKKF